MEDLFQPDSDESPEVDEDAEPTEKPESPAPASRTSVETHRVRPPLLKWLAAILAVLIIAFLLVLLARWIYHATHNNANSNPPAVTQQSPAGSSSQKTSGSQPAGGNPAAPSGNSQITNTGPGDIPAIFAGSTLVAAGLHFIWTVRRDRRRA